MKGKGFGLSPSKDDLHWLNRVRDEGVGAPLPGFNRSRLIAMSLVELTNEGMVVTERGKQLLGAQTVANRL